MTEPSPLPSPRKAELLEAAYAYALAHGLGDLSLRPLAAAIGSSPRVLLYLFGSKEGLIQALLARARTDELAMLDALKRDDHGADFSAAALEVWNWLSGPRHHDLLVFWLEGYARSLVDPAGPWAGFACQTVTDWLGVLASYQPAPWRRTGEAQAQRTVALAILRGGLLDLLATGERDRVTAAVRSALGNL